MIRIATIVEDAGLAAALQQALPGQPLLCTAYLDARSFYADFCNGGSNAVVVQRDLGDASGLDVLRFVREHADAYVPLVCLSPLDSEDDAVALLSAGADDYVVLPVSARLLAARLWAVLRRALEDRRAVQVGAYRIDRLRRVITRSGRPVNLTDKEFQLADLLLSNPDRVLTRDYLLNTVWNSDGDALTRTVDTHASRVRHKLGLGRANELWLRPVYGRGYQLVRQAATPSRCA